MRNSKFPEFLRPSLPGVGTTYQGSLLERGCVEVDPVQGVGARTSVRCRAHDASQTYCSAVGGLEDNVCVLNPANSSISVGMLRPSPARCDQPSSVLRSTYAKKQTSICAFTRSAVWCHTGRRRSSSFCGFETRLLAQSIASTLSTVLRLSSLKHCFAAGNNRRGVPPIPEPPLSGTTSLQHTKTRLVPPPP